jgi:hypothetical protein
LVRRWLSAHHGTNSVLSHRQRVLFSGH